MTTSTDAAPPPRTTRRLGIALGGFFMGAAEIVPGVSGGTIALVFGIYERLIDALSGGAAALAVGLRGDVRGFLARLRGLDWPFVLSLLAGMAVAIAGLTSLLKHFLDTEPVAMSALFLGLVGGSVVLARRELERPGVPSNLVVMVVVAVVTFAVLGLRSGRMADPSLPAYLGAASIAICAMILPGISGSFILLLMGMYAHVIDAVDGRDLVVLGVFALGAVIGLALFSSVLKWALDRHHDLVLSALIGLMAGSLRVLWPWPAGEDGVADSRLGAVVTAELPLVLAMVAVGIVVVVGIARIGDRITPPPSHVSAGHDRRVRA